MRFNPVTGMNTVLLEKKAGMVILFMMLMSLLPFCALANADQEYRVSLYAQKV